MEFASPLEDIEIVDVNGAAVAEDGHDQSQSHRHFRRGHGQDKEHEHLAVHGLEVIGKADEGQVDGVEHHFDAHIDDQGVAPNQDSDHPQGEQGHAQGQVILDRDYHNRSPLEILRPSLQLAFRQDHGPDDGHQEQDRRDFEGQQIVGEQAPGDGFGIAQARGHFFAGGQRRFGDAVNQDQPGETGQDDTPYFLPDKGDLGLIFRLPDIEEHDDKQEQHQDGPGVDDHLDSGDEFGVGQEVDACHRKEVDDEPEGAPCLLYT